MKACVIIPTFNESKEISRLVKEVKALGFDVLIIDDGSKDNTAQLAADSGAVVLKNPVNEGKGACLRKGFQYALDKGYEAIITMDGDGQHLPQDLPSFIRSASSSNSGLFVGNRMLDTRHMPLVRIVTNKFMSWLISLLSGQNIPDSQCGFRLIKREVLQKLELKTDKYEIETEMLIKASRAGFKIESVLIKTVYRGEKSQIHPLTDTLRFLKFITNIK